MSLEIQGKFSSKCNSAVAFKLTDSYEPILTIKKGTLLRVRLRDYGYEPVPVPVLFFNPASALISPQGRKS